MTVVAGLVLAAGAGRRFGGPKALAVSDGTPWVVRAVRRLQAGGCEPVLVVTGAMAADVNALLVNALLRETAIVVANPDWPTGVGSSVRAGLAAAAERPEVDAVVILPVDLPHVDEHDVRIVVAAVRSTTDPREVLLQAEFDGESGHPVAIGRHHWAAAAAAAVADVGARGYLRAAGATRVPLGGRVHGADVDAPGGDLSERP